MAEKNKITPINSEQKILDEVLQHYSMAKEDLEARLGDWKKKDELFRSWLSEDKEEWPYTALVFDPRIWTFVIEKSSRLIGGKPRGHLVPREGGDELGAMVNNELLGFYWDDVTRVGRESMISRWIRMDQNCRRYGASFALVPWHYERQGGKVFYDGPNFIPWNPRDVLANPSYTTIKNWIQLRRYATLQELENVNEVARTGPVYKNLDKLRERLKKEVKGGGDTRSLNWASRNLSIKGLTDYLGRDESFRVVEIITEYRQDRWITFAPRHGLILRDIRNPYDHGQIPVVMLKYYVNEEDIYGMAEVEPIEKLQNGANALICQYLDTVNSDLYPTYLIDHTKMRMHTIEFGPNKKWLGTPGPGGWDSAVKRLQTGTAATAQFVQTYSFMVSAMMNAMGESSLGVSNLPGRFQGDKTATEVRQVENLRGSRDNFNLIYLAEALKEQMMFWHQLTKQFLFRSPEERTKIIRIVGKDALDYFQRAGFATIHPTEEEILKAEREGTEIPPASIERPVALANGETVAKLQLGEFGQTAQLVIEPDDLSGTYDYIPDIESWRQPSDAEIEQKLNALLAIATNPHIAQALAAEGKRLKVSELVTRAIEASKIAGDAEVFFEKLQPNQLMMGGGSNGQARQIPAVPPEQGGIGGPAGGIIGAGVAPA